MKEILEKLDDGYWACHRFIRDYIFEPVWYRFFGHKHHIVKTKLTPAPWYDTDTRILYSVMELVVWFVDNDMRIFTEEEYLDEIERVKKEGDKETQKDEIKGWKEQWKRDQEIVGIANWWKNYPRRCKEIDKAISAWHAYTEEMVKKYEFNDFFAFLNNRDVMTKEEKKKEKRLSKFSHNKEEALENEEQEYLKKAIDLRGHMWS